MDDKQVTYDEYQKKYIRPVFDLYKYYEDGEPNFDELLNAMSVGMLDREHFRKEDGTIDIPAAIMCGRDLMKLWVTDVSPKPFMKKRSDFAAAVKAYTEEAGIESAVDAYIAGVPIDDLLA